MNHLPPMSELFTPHEIQMNIDEEARLLDDRPRVTHWFAAPGGTVRPAPDVDGVTFVTEWLDPWVRLNDPESDRMDGVLIADRGDPSGRSGGMFILTNPTVAALEVWSVARASGTPVTFGAERHAPPGYRAFFPIAYAIPPVPGTGHARFSLPAPLDDTPVWHVQAISGGPGGWA